MGHKLKAGARLVDSVDKIGSGEVAPAPEPKSGLDPGGRDCSR